MINILRELCRSKKGRIEGVSMADMLQLIWLEKMSCQLLVRYNGRLGTLNIQDGKLIVLIPMGEFAWGMLVDGKKTQLGLLLNVALPKAIAAFEDAVTSN